MYNSFVVALIMRVVRAVQDIYKNSYIKRFIGILKKHFRKLTEGSVFLEILNRDGIMFKNSYTYKLIGKFFGLFDWILKGFHGLTLKLTKGSRFSEGLGDYSRDITSGLGFVYDLLFFTGLVFLLGGLVGFSLVSPTISIVLIAVSLIGKVLNGSELIIIKNSAVANFVLDLFRLDKEGDEWW